MYAPPDAPFIPEFSPDPCPPPPPLTSPPPPPPSPDVPLPPPPPPPATPTSVSVIALFTVSVYTPGAVNAACGSVARFCHPFVGPLHVRIGSVLLPAACVRVTVCPPTE